jgi:hypothetical protein
VEQPGYAEWNDALTAFFFTPERASQTVYLFVTPDIIAQVGLPFGAGIESFCAALCAGPEELGSWGHCQRALHVEAGWRERDYSWPPYFAYLALFVLAAGHEGDGDFDPRSYYPRLWELLGEPREGTPPSFDRMFELWDDLEQWSVRDMGGELGLFEARIVGEKFHIGLPLAQTIFTEVERHALPGIFAKSGFEPGTLPSGRELLRALRVDGRHSLRRRTTEALARGPESFVGAVLDAASTEFLAWDGSLPDRGSTPGAAPRRGAGLRITLAIDRIARSAAPGLRCRTTHELPAGGLTLVSQDAAAPLACMSYLPGWSALISAAGHDDDPPAAFVPPGVAWRDGLTLTDAATQWTLRLRSTRIRIFIAGTDEQLPGLIEILELPRGRPFYVAFDGSVAAALHPWFETGCVGWQPLTITAGLPDGWQFGYADEAVTDAVPRSVDDAIGFRDRRALRLAGGIRAAAGNTYFDFAPPHIVLEGASPGDELLCNGKALLADRAGSGTFVLPPDPPPDARIGIEVRNGEDVVKRVSLYLNSGAPWRISEPLVTIDEYGHPTAQGEIAGAWAPEPLESFHPDPLLLPGLQSRTGRVYFIGRAPGQISVWPGETPSWPAVWAIPFGRRGEALYCGDSLDGASPTADRYGDAERAELWREVLWRHRKRIKPPTEHALRALWREYQDAARV